MYKYLTVILLGIFVAVLIIIFSTQPTRSQASIFYVDSAGNDSNDGSIASPWKTLDKACSMANAGTTIIVRGGTYPGNYCHGQAQGTATQPITLKAFPGETPVFTGTHPYQVALNLFGSYWNVEGLKFDQINLSVAVNINNANEIHVKNLTLTNNAGAELLKITRSSNISVQSSIFDTTGTVDNQGQGDCIAIMGGTRVLIEGNTFSRCGHSAVDVMNANEVMSSKVIVRNNNIDQHWGGGIYIIRGTQNTLVESNTIANTGEKVNYPKACIQVAGQNGIYRRNTCRLTGLNQVGYTLAAYTYAGIVQSPQHNRIYNEDIYRASYVAFQMVQKDIARIDDNKIVNSIFYHNKTQGPQEPYWAAGNNYITADSYQSTDSSGVYFPWDVFAKTQFIGNFILHADDTGDKPNEPRMVYHQTRQVADLVWSLAAAQQAFPWKENKELNPGFVNADAGDFRLAPNSPAIDAGQNLTVTTASGTSNVIPVEDSGFFTDGWGMIPGDSVRIGATTANVILVEPGKLTLDKSITFTNGQAVNLAFNGNGPDVGAIESGGTLVPTPTPSPIATPTPTSSPSPSPSPTPVPTPVPAPLCTMLTNSPVASQWSDTKLVVTFIGLSGESSTVTALASSGQVTVNPFRVRISGVSAVAEFQLSVKKKSSSISISGPCGVRDVLVRVQ